MSSDVLPSSFAARVGIGLRVLLSVFLFGAAIGKALDLAGYVTVLGSYEPGLPVAVLRLLAPAIALVEAGLALWILSGFRPTAAGLAGAGLLTVYLAVMAVTLLRGVEVPNCGCFGVFLARPLTPFVLAEALFLIVLFVGLALVGRRAQTY